MRLQLDTAVTGAGIARPGDAGAAGAIGGSGTNSRQTNAGASGDSIQISGASSALASLSADRAARIQQLTALVQSGTYQVSSARIGSSIVDHAISAGAGEG